MTQAIRYKNSGSEVHVLPKDIELYALAQAFKHEAIKSVLGFVKQTFLLHPDLINIEEFKTATVLEPRR